MQRRPIALLLSFVLGGVLESAAGWSLLTSAGSFDHPARFVLLSHLAACSLLAPGFLLLLPPAYRQDKGISLLLILGLSTPLPIVGPGLVFLFAQYIVKRAPAPPLEANYHFGDRQYSSGTEQSAGNTLTRSLLEHLRSPDIEVRRNAILAARRVGFPSAIPILRLAQQDSDEQVRIFARNTLGQITETLEGSLKAIETANLDPQQQLDRVMFIAEQFGDYVELGLITEAGRKAHLDKVIRLLSQSLAAEPDNKKVRCLLLKYCLQARYSDQAKAHLVALKKLAPAPDVTLPWELELHFQDRDWPALSATLNVIQTSHSQDPQLIRAYEFWHPQASATR